MNILYFLIGCSILMALLFLGAFFWSLKDGQQDDMVTPGIRILFDDDSPLRPDQDDFSSETKVDSDKDHISL